MSILEQLMKELGNVQQKHTQPTIYHNNPTVHGENALFGVLGAERDVISSRTHGMGLASALSAMPTVDLHPLYPYLVGKNLATGSQPTERCDDAPISGAYRSAMRTAKFGAYQFETRNLDITRAGELINRGETMDLRLVNDPLVEQMGAIFPTVAGGNPLMYGNEMLLRMLEVAEDFQEVISMDTYVGNGTGNTIFGLETLVSATQYDALTGVTIASLASDIRDFGDVDVTTTAGAVAIVNSIVDMFRFARQKARTQKMLPTQWVLVMRSQLFTTLSTLWPSSMQTFGAIARNDNVSINISADAGLAMAQAMQQGSYLSIDGVQVPVIQDDWMPEDQLGANQFASDIYLLPLTTRGGNALYWDYFDYARGTSEAIRQSRSNQFFWTNAGKYLWTIKPPKNWCVMLQSIIEPRLVLKTPQFAGRLQNIAYSLEQHWADPGTLGDYSVSTDGNAYYLPNDYYQADGNIG